MQRSHVGLLLLLSLVLAAPALAAEWQPNVSYAAGNLVTYQGPTYRCLQAHTSLVGWEPPSAPALWQIESGTATPTPTATPTATARPSVTPTTICPTPTLPPTPRPLTGLTAAAGNTWIQLSWQSLYSYAAAYKYSYEVLRGSAPGGPYSVIATVTTNSNLPVFADVGLVNGTRYYYVVRLVTIFSNPPPCPTGPYLIRGGLSNEASAVPAASATPGPTPTQPGGMVSTEMWWSKTSVPIGQTLVITAHTNLGVPQQTLRVLDGLSTEQSETNPIFTPARPAPIYTNTASWTLTAVRSGYGTLFVSASGEIYDPACSCWVMTSTFGRTFVYVQVP